MGLRVWSSRCLIVGATLCAWAAIGPAASWADPSHPVTRPEAALRPVSHQLTRDVRLLDRVSEAGQRAHGLYFNAPVQHRLGPKGIIRTLRKAHMNAAVLDMKDGQGRVVWDTHIPSLIPERHLYFKDVPGFIAELKRAGIYTIGRVVCFNDPYLPRNEPDRAVLDDRPGHKGKVWATWGHRNPWLDPYNTRNHDLIVAIAKEIEALGLDEIQFDYIRFPVDRATRFAKFPAQTDTPRPQVIVSMLRRVDEAIKIPIGADVFGVSIFHYGDSDGLGQVPELWSAHVDVFTPMLYLDGMTSWGKPGPGRAERLIFAGIQKLRHRIGKGPVIRPFLQAFARNADYYNPAFIAEQIRGARDAGADGFLFWSPGSSYRMVQAGMAGPAGGLLPFPIEARIAYRARRWPKAGGTQATLAGAGADGDGEHAPQPPVDALTRPSLRYAPAAPAAR